MKKVFFYWFNRRLFHFKKTKWLMALLDPQLEPMDLEKILSLADPLLWQEFKESQKACQDEIRYSESCGARTILYGDPLYPEEFYRLQDPPLCLQILANPSFSGFSSGPLASKKISIVGSRNPTSETLQWIQKELPDLIRSRSLVTVSGGAFGVDQEIHRTSLRCQLPTIALLPSGLGELYPSALQQWVKPILDCGGLLMSEFSYHQSMQKRFFLHRNRLIAGFSQQTLVLQAQQKSGTMITALQAAQNGREVLVLPGHPMDSYYSGSLQLLSDGATMVRNAEDLGVFLM